MKLKTWETMTEEERDSLSWQVMRCLEEKVPREIKTTANILAIMLAVSTLPNIGPSGEPDFIDKDQFEIAAHTSTGLANLFRILFHVQATHTGVDVVAELANVFKRENVTWEHAGHTLNEISQRYAQKFLKIDGTEG